MRYSSGWALTALMAFTRAAAAQGGSVDPQCAALIGTGLAVQDACQKAVDIYHFIAPQLSIAIIGGNAVLGESAPVGRIGHVSAGLRANLIVGRLPRADLVTPSISGAVATDYHTDRLIVGLPALDAAIGVFPGIRLPGAQGLAFDLLVNVAYIPTLSRDEVRLSAPNGSVRLGFGGRLVLLGESIFTPAITATYLSRDLPTLDLIAPVGADELAVRQVKVETDAWRILIGKHLGPFELTAGGGQDHYDRGANITARITRAGQEFTAGPVAISQRLTRDNAFVGASLVLPLVRFGLEIGRVNGGDIPTFNTFGGAEADDALFYGSFGLRFHW